MACYGREIMEAVAKKEQVSIQALEQCEERCAGSFLYSLFVMSQSQTGDPDLLSGEAKLHVAETRMIREFARRGPAIFVGHCAAQALKEEPGVLRVFVRSSQEEKEHRAVVEYGIPEEEVAAVCRRFNKRRENYYNFCTGSRWKDPENYDLVLDSGTLGIEGCVRVLAALTEK